MSAQTPTMTQELNSILQFLYGADELDGVMFGEHPVGKPRYWWRSKLRAAVERVFGSPVVRVGEHNGGDYDMTHRSPDAGMSGSVLYADNSPGSLLLREAQTAADMPDAIAECCHQTMLIGTRCEGCPLAKPSDTLVPRRKAGVDTSRAPSYICPKCRVDRFKVPCPGPHADCPMKATALGVEPSARVKPTCEETVQRAARAAKHSLGVEPTRRTFSDGDLWALIHRDFPFASNPHEPILTFGQIKVVVERALATYGVRPVEAQSWVDRAIELAAQWGDERVRACYTDGEDINPDMKREALRQHLAGVQTPSGGQQ
jgi:hypothetical protein